MVISIRFISPLDLKGARALYILFLLILYILLMLEMPSLAPCVWPQLDFSCFYCSKTTTTLSIICTGNRQPWNDLICKPHWHPVTHISHAGADASSQTITSATSEIFAMLSSRASAHIPEAHSSILPALNLLMCPQKTAAITRLSPNLQAICFLCKMFQ